MSKLVKVTEQEFNLRTFKIKNGKVEVTYSYSENVNGVIEQKEVSITSKCTPHPDLIALYQQLREYLAKELKIETTPNNLSSIEVTKVTMKDEKVLISGEIETLTGGISAINSSLINLEDGDEFENELIPIIDCIKDEVYKFLFSYKRAELDLFESPEEIEEPKKEIKGGLNVA